MIRYYRAIMKRTNGGKRRQLEPGEAQGDHFMNIQFVRLELDVCEVLNQIAHQQRRTVSELVNQLLRQELTRMGELPAGEATAR
jgi:hypothetical protein